MEYDLLAITGIDPDLWAAARSELEAAALVTIETIPGVNPPFLQFHPTLLPYLSAQLPEDRRAALEDRYWKRYYGLANYLYNADTQTPHQARAIAQRELPNLRRAFDLALGGGAAAEAVDFANSIGRFLEVFGRRREQAALLASLEGLDLGGGEGLTKAKYLSLSQRGEMLLGAGRTAQAEAVFRNLLARLEAGAAYDAAYDQAYTIWNLGRCLADQGRPAQALDWQRRALAGFEALAGSADEGTSKGAKKMAGTAHTDLADLHAALGEYGSAEVEYKAALAIDEELGDWRGKGVDLIQLGTLALRRGDLAEAERRYREALDTFRALGEPASEAVVWHQLGLVAQRARQWDEAEHRYREAVRIREQIRDLPLLAGTCNQLGMVAENAGRPGDAERWYLRAIELGEQLGDRKGLAVRLNNLAALYLAQGRLDEAAEYGRRALGIVEGIGDPSLETWKDYALQAQIAEARGRAEEAADWRRKEQASYAAYAGAAHQLPPWAPPFIAAVAAAAQGDEATQVEVEQVLPQLEATKDWSNLPPVVRRILNGESDTEQLCIGLDRIDAYIIRTILARLSGEALPAPTPTQPSAAPQEAGQLSPQAAAILKQWAPIIAAVAAACAGNEEAAAGLESHLQQLAAQDDWRALAAALRQVLAGERDPAALLPGLDDTDRLILGATLAALQGPAGGGQGQPQQLTPQGLVDLVGQACRPDAPAGLGAQLHALTRQLQNEAGVPPELRALGRVLHAVLSGDCQPDLAGLPAELAAAVRAMLGGLEH